MYVQRQGPCGLYYGGKQNAEVLTCDGVEFKFASMRPYYSDVTTAGILYKNV